MNINVKKTEDSIVLTTNYKGKSYYRSYIDYNIEELKEIFKQYVLMEIGEM